jgi:localization factor PodJL
MTAGLPGHMKGVRREVIDSAREAARRAGMSVEEWLDTVIVESARNAGIEPEHQPPAYDERPPPAESRHAQTLAGNDPAHETHSQAGAPFSDVRTRLDALSRQLDDLARIGEARQQARHQSHLEDTPRLIAEAVARLDRKIDRLATDGHSADTEIERRANVIDRAVARIDRHDPAWPDDVDLVDQATAEIAARMRMLESGASAPIPDLPRAPTQRLPDLEQLLREINTQVETVRPCSIDNAIDTIRNDLAEIGLMVREAMPRHAIEALETEIRSLASRIDHERHDGTDRVAITGLERGLAEVRDALQALTPAESLAGFDQTVHSLSQKIDRIAKTGQDHPQVLKQLEAAIVALRSTVANVASNDALSQLSAEVRALATKVDQVSVSDAFAAMERRIAVMADALQESRSAPAPDSAMFETAVQGLADKIDQLRASYSDQPAISELEQRIATLIDKFEASGSRLDHLETIERALADLLIHIESLRMSAGRGAIEGADADALKRDVQRTQDSLETMHGTLGHVVDRLATIEAGINKHPRGQEVLASPSIAPTQMAIYDPPQLATTLAPSATPSMVAERRPIDPNLPPDHPLEPGGGPSRGGNSAADRIAASEAALQSVRSPAGTDPTNRSDFIAAARRAAQAAMEAPQNERRKPSPDAADDAGTTSSSGLIAKLAIAASISLLVLGAMLYATTRFGWYGAGPTAEATVQATPEETPDPAVAATPEPPNRRSVALPPNILAPPQRPPVTDISAPPPPPIPVPNLDTTGTIRQPASQQTGSLPPAAQSPAEEPRAASPQATTSPVVPPLPQPSPVRGNGADRSTTGNTNLHTAAANGDPAAAFEIASRLADGRGVQQNLSEAAVWFERAAAKGLVPAQFRLGGLYEKGLGVRKNLDTARRLYTAAANAGHAKAMHNLAVLYAEGIEGKPDYATASRWFRKAADHGVVDSQYNLAILYARGIGVETNLPEAFKWFALASREGDRDAAKKRDDVASRLDKQSLAAAMAAAKAWQPQPLPQSATEVPAPPGGWDGVAPPATAKRGGSRANVQSRRPAQ